MRELHDEPLAPRTTMQLGGPARRLLLLESEQEVIATVRRADTTGTPFVVLGGGSNVLVADRGLDCLVLSIQLRGITERVAQQGVHFWAAAGETWDDLVRTAIGRGLAGIECLSGIPGLVGAAPIQNIGAYGQEIGNAIVDIRAYDRQTDRVAELSAEQCAFGYRDSIFKGSARQRYIVLGLTLRLQHGPPEPLRYAELQRALSPSGGQPSLIEIRDTVLRLRRGKSMVVDPDDPDSRSAGSFFVNPLVDRQRLAAIQQHARAQGIVATNESIRCFDAGEGAAKLSAAWLIERAGFHRGYATGHVGISRHHALAIVNRGGGTAGEVIDLARAIRNAVAKCFGVHLVPEPVLLGFGDTIADLTTP